ncbi:head completion protein [Pseudomonas aeruginosa]|nr:head completion protein [Pseudomonas aeruginosa]
MRDTSELVQLYLRAVQSATAAEVAERYRWYDTTTSGNDKAQDIATTIDDYRRDQRWAIRDFLKRSPHDGGADLMAAVAIAHQNDTVEALCWRHYGRTAGVTEAVLEAKPRPGRPRPHPSPGLKVTMPDIRRPPRNGRW